MEGPVSRFSRMSGSLAEAEILRGVSSLSHVLTTCRKASLARRLEDMLRELHPGKVASLTICFSKLVSGVCLSLLLVPAALRADTPISPDASRESRALLAFLHHTYGKNIISGQQEGW